MSQVLRGVRQIPWSIMPRDQRECKGGFKNFRILFKTIRPCQANTEPVKESRIAMSESGERNNLPRRRSRDAAPR